MVASRPRAASVPYPLPRPPGAAPKGISGRTSYLRARLAFHPYPQLLPAVCNRLGCGPPVRVNGPSPWPWVARPVSGLPGATPALFRLAFAPPPAPNGLKLATPGNSPAHSSISTRSGFRPLTACRRTVSGSLHSPPGGLFTVPSRYWSTIGRQEYLALEGGPPRFPRDFPCPAVLKHASRPRPPFRLRGSHPLRPRFPPCSARAAARRATAGAVARRGFQPRRPNAPRLLRGGGLGCSAFAHHY